MTDSLSLLVAAYLAGGVLAMILGLKNAQRQAARMGGALGGAYAHPAVRALGMLLTITLWPIGVLIATFAGKRLVLAARKLEKRVKNMDDNV